jgi:hypothetical protein
VNVTTGEVLEPETGQDDGVSAALSPATADRRGST